MSESFAELFEQSIANDKMKPGTILDASVVAVNSDVVIVNAGLKSELHMLKRSRGRNR